jgi:hypothetical protein
MDTTKQEAEAKKEQGGEKQTEFFHPDTGEKMSKSAWKDYQKQLANKAKEEEVNSLTLTDIFIIRKRKKKKKKNPKQSKKIPARRKRQTLKSQKKKKTQPNTSKTELNGLLSSSNQV